MQCRVTDLNTGERIGYVGDVEVILPGGQIAALVVPGAGKCFGLLGREDDVVIPWGCVRRFGDDVILVDSPGVPQHPEKPRKRWV